MVQRAAFIAASAAEAIFDLTERISRPCRDVGREPFQRKERPNGSTICTAIAAADFSRFLAIIDVPLLH